MIIGARTKLFEHDEALRVAREELARFRAAGDKRGEAVTIIVMIILVLLIIVN